MFKAREAFVKYKSISSPLDTIENPSDVYKFFKKMAEWETRENFYCLYLDNRNRVVCFEKIGIGTSNAALVDIKEVIRTGLLVGADRFILAHNHPSGVCEPSEEDLTMTHAIKNASKMFSIELTDHVVIGNGQFTSLKERGIL